ncbi:MAG: hypothetical protein OIN85_01105 [Candidatus Methanoperedens sp.]|nr:hypothetical protein [Candidatus Methanoperedens sp.]
MKNVGGWYFPSVVLALLIGALIGWHKHPTLTLFCPGEQIEEVIEADAPLSQLDGWVEYRKYESGGFFRSWDDKPQQYQKSDCSAFLYE